MGLPSTPAYWDGARWIVSSASPLTRDQLRRIGAWLRQVQAQRRVGLAPGSVRDECDQTIRALDDGQIECALTPEYSGPDGQQYAMFRATAGTGRVISLGAC